MIRLLLFFISLCTFVKIDAQPLTLEGQRVDSTLNWLETTMRDNPESYHTVAMQTLSRAYQTDDPVTIAEAHGRLADWHGFHNFFGPDSCLYHSEKKLAHYLLTDNQVEIAQCYLTLTIDYLNNGRFEEGQKAAFSAIDIFEDLGDTEGLGKAFRTLSTVFMIQEQSREAIRYARKAIAVLSDYPEQEITIALARLNLITSYNQLEAYDKSIAVADSCLDVLLDRYPEEFGIIARALCFRADAHIKQKNYDLALMDYTDAWQRIEDVVGPERASTYRTDIGKTLRYMGRNEEAIPHLEVGLAQFEQMGMELTWEVYRELSLAYEGVGRYQEALTYKDKYITAYGEMLESKVSNLETEAAIKYETEKKDETLSVQAQVIAQQKQIQRLSWGIALVLGVLFTIMFFLFRRIRKTAHALGVKNAENELLLREIHHRVKNNLAVVSSLLKLQALQSKDADVKDAMEASQRRVQSMGILHQKLYEGERLSTIDMLDYFKNLSDKILDIFQAHDQVKIKLEMGEIDLDSDTAVPIGLIVNELLTNSLKYAFPEGKKGEIAIRLRETAVNALELEVADNGVGVQNKLAAGGTGFGSQLVQLLTQQLQGSLTTDFTNGSRFLFQLERAIPR